MKPGEFTDNYLKIDEDEDYIFQSMPCPFLGVDKYCSVYENRPGACRDYPHTDNISFKKYTSEMLENTLICPGVFLVFEKMKDLIP